MKKHLFPCLVFLFVLYLVPALFAFSSKTTPDSHRSQPINHSLSKIVSVYFTSENSVRKVNLEEYLTGVIAAEMPVSFPLEALKAQAVASRSYILDKMTSGGKKIEGHNGADVCTDSAHCKAWMSKEERIKNWPEKDREKNWEKISAAVSETSGEYMTYNDEPITAVFYAISSGTTERAEDVWGSDVPYLQNADSSMDINAPGYHSAEEFTPDQFRQKMIDEYPDIKLSASPAGWYSDEIRSSGGAVKSCRIGNKTLKGTDVRKVFGLRSHNYTLTFKNNRFIFDVTGYGHGVGMSQWGAKFYAEQGKNYRDILRIYYSGISFAGLEI